MRCFGLLFEVLVTVWAQFCEIDGGCGVVLGRRLRCWCWMDGRVLGQMLFGVLVEILVTVWVHFGEIDGRVLGGMQVGGLVQVLCRYFKGAFCRD